MHWSKLRQLVEERAAPALAGRVRVMVTRYRRAHDQEGRWAIVIDDREIGGFDTISTFREEESLINELAVREKISPREAQPRVKDDMRARAHHTMEDFVRSLKTYLDTSIEGCLVSKDAVIRSLGFLDARLGKRRLVNLDIEELKTEVERECLRARLEAEGMHSTDKRAP